MKFSIYHIALFGFMVPIALAEGQAREINNNYLKNSEAELSPASARAACVAAPGSVKLKVMTYNIHKGVGALTDLQAYTGPEKELLALEEIAKLIGQSKADVVLLQEADISAKKRGTRHQAEWLAQRLGYRHYANFTTDGQHIFEPGMAKAGENKLSNAILSKYPLSQLKIMSLSYDPTPTGKPKFPTESRRSVGMAQITVGEKTLEFWVTHLEVAMPTARLRQAKEIEQKVEERGISEIPLVLGGDLNTDEFSSPANASVFETLRKHFFFISEKKDKAKTTISRKYDIDHLGYQPGAGGSVVMWDYEAIDDIQASDHKPVMANFCFR